MPLTTVWLEIIMFDCRIIWQIIIIVATHISVLNVDKYYNYNIETKTGWYTQFYKDIFSGFRCVL